MKRAKCPVPCSALTPEFRVHLAWLWTYSFLWTLPLAVTGASYLPTFPQRPSPPLPTCLPQMPAFSSWHGSSNCFWPCQLSCAAGPGAIKAPNYVFSNRHALWLYHLFINQNPLPLAMWPTSFYVDNMFCHFGKCKQTNTPSCVVVVVVFPYWSIVDIQYPSFLVISRKGREEMKRKCLQDWALSVSHKEFS